MIVVSLLIVMSLAAAVLWAVTQYFDHARHLATLRLEAEKRIRGRFILVTQNMPPTLTAVIYGVEGKTNSMWIVIDTKEQMPNRARVAEGTSVTPEEAEVQARRAAENHMQAWLDSTR